MAYSDGFAESLVLAQTRYLAAKSAKKESKSKKTILHGVYLYLYTQKKLQKPHILRLVDIELFKDFYDNTLFPHHRRHKFLAKLVKIQHP